MRHFLPEHEERKAEHEPQLREEIRDHDIEVPPLDIAVKVSIGDGRVADDKEKGTEKHEDENDTASIESQEQSHDQKDEQSIGIGTDRERHFAHLFTGHHISANDKKDAKDKRADIEQKR